MPVKLFDLARMTVSSSGTGTINLNAAVTGFNTFAQAGVASGDVIGYAINDTTQTEIGYGTYTSGAPPTLTRNVIKATGGSSSPIAMSNTAQVAITPTAEQLGFPVGVITGLVLSYSNTTTFGISAGSASDSTNYAVLTIGSAFTKTTSAWAVGTGNGGLDSGAIAASTWYHVYIIMRPDTYVNDIIFSTNASAPTLPAGYVYYRRIGSIKTDGSSHWLAFTQIGNDFFWDVPVNDIDAVNPGTAVQTLAVNVPLGLQVIACGACGLVVGAATTHMLMTEVGQTDTAPTATLANVTGIASARVKSYFRIRTNTSQALRYRLSASDGSTEAIITTLSWTDYRNQY